MIHGIINLNKPPALSSARAVGRVKRLLPRGTKIGHAGTLDPFATGVLLLLVGKATKSCERLMGQRKGYEAVIKLGARTASDDPERAEEFVEVLHPPTEAQVRAAAASLTGAVQQRPPAFSALKVGGKRAYKLARRGREVEIAPRPVMIHVFELLHYAWPLARVRVECGRGTYIRALARDLGELLGVGGYLTQLKRTFIGQFRIEAAVTLESLEQQGIAPHLAPLT